MHSGTVPSGLHVHSHQSTQLQVKHHWDRLCQSTSSVHRRHEDQQPCQVEGYILAILSIAEAVLIKILQSIVCIRPMHMRCSISSIQGTNVPQIYNQMPTSSSPRHAPPSLAWPRMTWQFFGRPEAFDGILLAIWPGTDWCEESTCHSSHAKSFLVTSSIVWLPSYSLST